MNTIEPRIPGFLRPFIALIIGFTIDLTAANWPEWRGPHGDRRCDEKNLPLRWATNENIAWRAPLPDRGNSTPVIWGNRIFLTQAQAKDKRRSLMCLDRATGNELWQQGPVFETQEPTHDTNPNCSGSPATDGTRVISWFGSAGLYCHDFKGKELWHRDMGPQRHIWGNGSSPAIHGNLVYLNFGPGEPSFLIALDKRTGKEVWRTSEPNADSGEKKPGQEKPRWSGSWSTPVFAKLADRDQLLMSWPLQLMAFEPATGKPLWNCGGLNEVVYTSPLHEDDIVVAMGGYGGKAIAVRAGGAGDVTESRRLWQHPKARQRIGSGVIHDGHIYILTDPGIAECWELKTGKLVYEERLTGAGKDNTSWSSMVLAGDRLYVVNHSGDTFVLRASPQFELLATNSLGEHVEASIAASGGELFIRTHRALWCIGPRR